MARHVPLRREGWLARFPSVELASSQAICIEIARGSSNEHLSHARGIGPGCYSVHCSATVAGLQFVRFGGLTILIVCGDHLIP